MNRREQHFNDVIHHVDNTTKDANYYIGSVLMAKQPIGIWSAKSLTSTLKRTVVTGGYVGKIFSWVVDDKGQLWWMVDYATVDGKPLIGFVLMGPGKFDMKTAEETSDLRIQQDKDAQFAANNTADIIENAGKKIIKGSGDFVAGVGETLGGIGKYFGWIIATVVIIGIVIALSEIKTITK